MLKDRKLKLHKIDDTLRISEGRVFTILRKHLWMKIALFEVGAAFAYYLSSLAVRKFMKTDMEGPETYNYENTIN